ncbi:hypothetical protein FHS90_002650 [Rufibacter quisquiliarum]|uniref:Uncharacterized protein n=1 Tax=Rufibacter quisquiliarum TaxID=1549639 RepID=A0A839GW02_9BACT|nr:hypothetical protein [Rufibacter quisquiliarum]
MVTIKFFRVTSQIYNDGFGAYQAMKGISKFFLIDDSQFNITNVILKNLPRFLISSVILSSFLVFHIKTTICDINCFSCSG